MAFAVFSNRRTVIEQDKGELSKDFGSEYEFESRGGCLADEVGTGKTATSIGMMLLGETGNGGDTLVVAPSHLITQWQTEVQKFTDDIEVIVGKGEYDLKCKSATTKKNRVVLVPVDHILKEQRLWYDFRRVFKRTAEGSLRQICPSSSRMSLYREAALFSNESALGPCGYEGWIYTGSLHLAERPWRRVILDEIQDLVADGTESQKNLLQLTRTAQNVWLLSATPFPHGNKSVYANHELLGFCRLKLSDIDYYVNTNQRLPSDHTFEIIKSKLYIKSPKSVADQAVAATEHVVRQTCMVKQLDVERKFYDLEMNGINDLVRNETLFHEIYHAVREMTVHPAASRELRKQMNGDTGRATSVAGVAQKALFLAKQRLSELEAQELTVLLRDRKDTKFSLDMAIKVREYRENNPRRQTNVFDAPMTNQRIAQIVYGEALLIHTFCCRCEAYGSEKCKAGKPVRFRVVRDRDEQGKPEFKKQPRFAEWVASYFNSVLAPDKIVSGAFGHDRYALDNYITNTTSVWQTRNEKVKTLKKEQAALKQRIASLSSTTSGDSSALVISDSLAAVHGSKPAALIRHLQAVVELGEQALVFSYWHDTLKLVGHTLAEVGLDYAFCDKKHTERALSTFTQGDVPILLMSAHSKASGANLQCATHVILLDPSGKSAEHGYALEQQAIGRAVRMGQLRKVTVTRFCVTGTMEEELFRRIDQVAELKRLQCANEHSYVIQNSRQQAYTSLETVEPVTIKQERLPGAQAQQVLREVTPLVNQENHIAQPPQPNAKKSKICVQTDPKDQENNYIAPKLTQPIVDERISANTQNTQQPHCSDPLVSQMTTKTVCNTDPQAQVTVTETHTATSAISIPTVSADARAEALKLLLRRADLSEYESKFLENGFDSVPWLYEVANDAAMLKLISSSVTFSKGHALRFEYFLIREAEVFRAQFGIPAVSA